MIEKCPTQQTDSHAIADDDSTKAESSEQSHPKEEPLKLPQDDRSESVEQEFSLADAVVDYVEKSSEGRTLTEIKAFLDSQPKAQNIDAKALLDDLTARDILKMFRFRYSKKDDNE